MGQGQGLGEAAVAPRTEAPKGGYMWLPGLRLPPLEERRFRVDSEGRDSGNGTCVKG